MAERLKATAEITDRVRESARQILSESTDLLILEDEAIGRFAADLEVISKEAPPASFAPSTLPLEQELGLKLFFNAVNFCFKDPVSGQEYTYQTATGTVKRSSGLFVALSESGKDWDNLIDVVKLTPNEWTSLIQLPQNSDFYLGLDRGQRIQGLAAYLLGFGYRHVHEFLENERYEAGAIINSLSQSGYFTDEFHKRSQLFVNMADGVLRNHGREITNVEILTGMADYRVPQVFYNRGPVILSNELAEKLSAQVPLEPKSREVRALRATVIEVIRRAAGILDITEGQGDTLTWTMSQQMAKANSLPIPHMLVATDEY